MTALAEETGAINLGQGFPDEDGPAAVVEAAVAALRAGHNQYAPLGGVQALRAAVVAHQRRHYGIELDPDAAGPGHLRGPPRRCPRRCSPLVGAGHEVLTIDPSYDSYWAIVRDGRRPAWPIMVTPRECASRFDDVAERVTGRTRVLLLNSPHNPTGWLLDARTRRLAHLRRDTTASR